MWRLTILFLLFLNVSQLSSQCGLFDLVAEPHACDESDMFLLDFEFEYVGVSDSFIVAGNGGSYGVFAYGELFYTIGPLSGDCITNYELVIYDQIIEDCQVAMEIGEVCCGVDACEIGELLVEVGECNDDGMFNVSINFDYTGVSDSFRVVGNGNQYGHFAYADLPIQIANLQGNCDLNYEFVVRDLEIESCASDIGIGEVCCGMEVCEIGELVVEVGECNDDEMFNVWINFEYSGVSELFQVQGNGMVYGQFSYNELPLQLGPFEGDCETDYEFVVVDVENESCNSVIEIGAICCGQEPCEIGELSVEVGECNDADLFAVFINFEYSGVSDSFSVVGNGNQYGHFAYADLPIQIANLQGNCDLNYEFVVRDLEIESCASDIGIGEVCCGMEVCEIGELMVEVGECNDDEMFNVWINFEYSGVSELFQVQGNGVVYGQYSYNELPLQLGPFEGDCETDYEFVVVDVENESCNSVIEIGAICCGQEPCEIGELSVEVGECNDADLFAVFINFEYSGVSDSFSVVGNGNQYGHFAYADLPIQIANLQGNCDLNYEFVVRDLEIESCASDIGIGEVCCGMEVCEIGELMVEVGECNDDEMFNVWINFEYSGVSELFQVQGNGVVYGQYSYNELPLQLGPFEGDCETDYELVVVDVENESCNSVIEIGEVCCGVEECEISNLLVVPTECNEEDQFYAVIQFQHVGTSENFLVIGNGNNYGTFMYEDLPIAIGPLEANCDTEYEFVIVDLTQESCIEEYNLGIVCCDECTIGDVNVISSFCNGALSFIELNFEYENVTGQGFTVDIGDDFYGFYSYDWLPEVLVFENNEQAFYDITICDQNNVDCCTTITVENPCFSTNTNEVWVDQIKLVYSNGDYRVQNETEEVINYSLYSIDGKLISEERVGAYAQKGFQTSGIPAGLYIVRFQSGIRFKTEKMIIQY